jgi:hypothetical protein
MMSRLGWKFIPVDFEIDPAKTVWEEYSHVVQQCSVCDKFRTNPIVTRSDQFSHPG